MWGLPIRTRKQQAKKALVLGGIPGPAIAWGSFSQYLSAKLGQLKGPIKVVTSNNLLSACSHIQTGREKLSSSNRGLFSSFLYFVTNLSLFVSCEANSMEYALKKRFFISFSNGFLRAVCCSA